VLDIDPGIMQLASAIFMGNIMTLAAYYSLRAMWDVKDGENAPWIAILGFLLPLAAVTLTMITAG